MIKDEALKLALVALENAVRYHGIMLMADPPQDAWKYHRVEDNAKQAITAIKKALAQPVQEPVAWGWRYDSCGHAVVNRLVATETSEPTLFLKNVFARGPFPLYAAPQPVQEPVALRDALAGALTSTYVCGRVWDAWNVGTMTQDDFQPAAECDELIDELVQAVAAATPPQPVQEPVAWAVQACSKMWRGEFAEIDAKAEAKRIGGTCVAFALYTEPPQREWQGLTVEEIDHQAKKDDHGAYFALGALWAEAKLKEKNK